MAPDNSSQQSLWNFDDKVSAILADLKAGFLTALFTADLETAYFNVRLLWVESDAKLDREKKMYPLLDEQGVEIPKDKRTMSEADYAAQQMQKLEVSRKLWRNKELTSDLFYEQLENFYMLICLFMKYNGLYFREGNDPARSGLRR